MTSFTGSHPHLEKEGVLQNRNPLNRMPKSSCFTGNVVSTGPEDESSGTILSCFTHCNNKKNFTRKKNDSRIFAPIWLKFCTFVYWPKALSGKLFS